MIMKKDENEILKSEISKQKKFLIELGPKFICNMLLLVLKSPCPAAFGFQAL